MTLPRIFAVQRGNQDAYLFEARRLDDEEPRYWAGGGARYDAEYEIRPYAPDSNMRYMVAFVAPSQGREGGSRCHVFIVEEPERRRHPSDWDYINHINIYIPRRREVTMRWHTTGRAIHLMTSPIPIPLLEVEADLPCTDMNRVRVVPSRPRDLEIWWEHWNPDRLIDRLDHSDSDSEREIRRRQRRARRSSGAAGGGVPAPAPAPAPGTVTHGSRITEPPATPTPPPIPKFVADTLIRDAVSRAATCPITMEPLAPETTAVTACFHLFERDAIAAWLAQADNCCAVCKQRTVLTV